MALGVDVASSSDTLFEERTMEDSRPGEARSGLLVRVNVGSVGEAGRPKACEPPQKGGFYSTRVRNTGSRLSNLEHRSPMRRYST